MPSGRPHTVGLTPSDTGTLTRRCATMAILYFPALVLVCLACVLLRGRPATALALYRAALLLATLPTLLHVRYLWGWISGFGDPQPRIGVYPGLVAFAATAVLATAGLLGVALWLAPRRPVLTAALPAALWLVYWFVCLRLLWVGAPDVQPVGNVPLVWLFGACAVATALLAVTAWLARRGAAPAVGRGEPSARGSVESVELD